MLMADVFSVALSILGFFLGLQGLWLLGAAVWPRRVAAARARVVERPVRLGLTGAAVALAGVVVASVLSRAGGPGQALAVVLLSLLVLWANVGLAGVASLIGDRLPSRTDDGKPWRRIVRGGVVLELAFLFPVLGWVVLFPVALVVGLGAAVAGTGERAVAVSGVPREEHVS